MSGKVELREVIFVRTRSGSKTHFALMGFARTMCGERVGYPVTSGEVTCEICKRWNPGWK
jgi:hypothetical protein